MNEQEILELIPTWTELFKSLKQYISLECRASDDPLDNLPGMCVTIGFTPSSDDSSSSWHFQTGDNSYSGGAYGHPHWAVVSLYRKSNSTELAKDAADQIAESVSQITKP